MHRIAHLARHAVVAVTLAAVVATSASAGPATLTLGTPGGAAIGRDDGRLQQLTVQSFQWGRRSGHSMLGASDRVTTGAAQAPDGGQYDALTDGLLLIRYAHDAPPAGPGVLVIRGSFPGCTAGKRYGGAQFASSSMRYELKDVVIANCAVNGMSLDYAKVTVRGWDPQPKKQ